MVSAYYVLFIRLYVSVMKVAISRKSQTKSYMLIDNYTLLGAFLWWSLEGYSIIYAYSAFILDQTVKARGMEILSKEDFL